MRRFRFPWSQIPDEEYVASLRRGMQFWNRWRYVMLTANVGLVIAAGYVADRGIRLMMQIAAPPGNQPMNWPLMGFTIGAMLGMFLGWLLLHSLHGLINAIGGMRSERLLLKYFDAYHTGQVADASTEAIVDDF